MKILSQYSKASNIARIKIYAIETMKQPICLCKNAGHKECMSKMFYGRHKECMSKMFYGRYELPLKIGN